MRLATGLLCVALVALFGAHSATADAYSRTANYDDQIVVQCADKNKAEVQILRDHSDTWHVGQQTIDLRMDRRLFARVQKYFHDCRIVVSNVESLVQEAEVQMFPEQMAEEQTWEEEVIAQTLPKCNDLKRCEAVLMRWEQAKTLSTAFLETYHPYDEIKLFYKTLASVYPSLVTYIPSIGKTLEGRDMPAVHITASKNPNRKRFYMQCQIHAREWITGGVCMYLSRYLVTQYINKDDRVKSILDELEFVMVPIVNPDGIAYTWEHDRLWRKNRHFCESSKERCGVDINRNFPLGYLPKGPSQMGAADYPGTHAKSEHETQNIINFFRGNAPIIGSIDWHSYGQLILRPYGYTNASAPDESFMVGLSNGMKNAIFNVHKTHYTAEKSESLYYCYGIAADWFYSNDAAKDNKGSRSASICIELRDTGSPYGFLLPADQIIPTAEEVIPAVLYYAEEVLKNPLVYNTQTAALEPPFDEKATDARHG